MICKCPDICWIINYIEYLPAAFVETAIFDQYLHRSHDIRYARWKEGRKTREIDFVSVDRASQKPNWALEIKWSNSEETSGLRSFMEANKLQVGWITTIDQQDLSKDIKKVPAAIMCYMIGKTPETWWNLTTLMNGLFKF